MAMTRSPEMDKAWPVADLDGLQTDQGNIGVFADKGIQVGLVRKMSCSPRKAC
jgi:hypothetical protein